MESNSGVAPETGFKGSLTFASGRLVEGTV